MTRLAAESLSLAFGEHTVVHSVDLAVEPGLVTVIVGPNGCGKSTLLRGLARLHPPAAGRVLLDGTDLRKLRGRDVARAIGILPQQPVAPEGIRAAELIARGRVPHQGWFGRTSGSDDEAVAQALAATDTTEFADVAVDQLSGGQRQRVWIAMVLAQQTDLLLLDEPTTFLDVAHQLELLDLFTELNRTRGTTVVMVLHDLNLAARYADRLVAMRDGRIVAQGDPADLVDPDIVRTVFGLDARVIPDPVSGSPLVVPIGRFHTGTEDVSVDARLA